MILTPTIFINNFSLLFIISPVKLLKPTTVKSGLNHLARIGYAEGVASGEGEGKGSTFYIELPIGTNPAVSQKLEKQEDKPLIKNL